VIRRAYRTRHETAQTIVEECLERLPHYQKIPEALLDAVRESVVHHLALFYRVTLETGRPLTADDLAPSVATARQRALQGVPLGEFLTFFLTGLTRLWEHLMLSVGDDAKLRAQLLDRVQPIISNQAQLMTALTEAYVEERERLSRSREHELDDFFQLLAADGATDEALDVRARTLGIPPGQPGVVAVFAAAKPVPGRGRNVQTDDLRRALADQLPGSPVWVGRTSEGFTALLPSDPDPDALDRAVEETLGEHGSVALGSGGHEIADLRRSAREALRALRIAAMVRRPGRVHRYADVAVLDLIGIGSSDAEAFMRRVLGPLAEPGASPTHLETLRQLAASGYRIKVAAGELSVHPHTLTYRMKQIRRRYGIDVDDPEVRLRVHLALLIRDAQDSDLPPRATRRRRGSRRP